MGGMIKNWLMQLDVLSMMTESTCNLVCPVIVKVPEFTRKKIDKDAWCSNSFYSHKNGYRMYLHVYAAGYHYGELVIVFVLHEGST